MDSKSCQSTSKPSLSKIMGSFTVSQRMSLLLLTTTNSTKLAEITRPKQMDLLTSLTLSKMTQHSKEILANSSKVPQAILVSLTLRSSLELKVDPIRKFQLKIRLAATSKMFRITSSQLILKESTLKGMQLISMARSLKLLLQDLFTNRM